jgi:hypothetical protein
METSAHLGMNVILRFSFMILDDEDYNKRPNSYLAHSYIAPPPLFAEFEWANGIFKGSGINTDKVTHQGVAVARTTTNVG